MKYLLLVSVSLLLANCGKDESTDNKRGADPVVSNTTPASTATGSNAASGASKNVNPTITAEAAQPEEVWAYTFNGYGSASNLSEGTINLMLTHYEMIKFPSGNVIITINTAKIVGGVVEEASYVMVAKNGTAKTGYYRSGQIDTQQLRVKYDGANSIQLAHDVDNNWSNNVDFTYVAVKQ